MCEPGLLRLTTVSIPQTTSWRNRNSNYTEIKLTARKGSDNRSDNSSPVELAREDESIDDSDNFIRDMDITERTLSNNKTARS